MTTDTLLVESELEVQPDPVGPGIAETFQVSTGVLVDFDQIRAGGNFLRTPHWNSVNLVLVFGSPISTADVYASRREERARRLQPLKEVEQQFSATDETFRASERLEVNLADARAQFEAAGQKAKTAQRRAQDFLSVGSDPSEHERAQRDALAEQETIGKRIPILERLFIDAGKTADTARRAAIRQKTNAMLAESSAREAALVEQILPVRPLLLAIDFEQKLREELLRGIE